MLAALALLCATILGAPCMSSAAPTMRVRSAAPAARTTKAPSLSASPVPAISGEADVFAGNALPRVVRPVQLQRYQSRRWVTVAAGHTSSTGSFKLTAKVTRTSTYRVKAARTTTHGGRVLAAVTTSSRQVPVVAQTATLQTPSSADAGSVAESQAIIVTVTATPVRTGRAVVVQDQDANGTWDKLANGVENADGTATITVTRNVPGAWQLRGVVQSANGASSWATAATTLLPSGAFMQAGMADNSSTSSYGGGDWATPDQTYYYTDSAGNLDIVTEDSSADTLSIKGFNLTTRQQVGSTTTISLGGWPDWGGFYHGPDGCFYVLVGQENPDQDDNLDVVAVRRYDAGWNLLGTAYVQGDATQGTVEGIYSPFAFSDPHMVLVGNLLVGHMARLIYAVNGIHHQVNLTFQVNVDTMQATTFDQLGGVSYSSHSFQQLVAMNGNDLVMIDQGDAYPREIQMGVMADYPAQRHVSGYDLFDFNGETGDNFTGADVTSLISGQSGIVVLGNSIPQPDAPNGPLGTEDENRNIYAISADPATGAHTVQWLTNFTPDGADNALEPRSVQVGPDEYAVLFSVQNGSDYSMNYVLINSAGTVLASASFPGILFCSFSDPIMIGGNVYWVGIDPSPSESPTPQYLFGLNVANPTTPSLL
jgi:hypothetical protein